MHILYYLIAAFQAGGDAASFAVRVPASSAPHVTPSPFSLIHSSGPSPLPSDLVFTSPLRTQSEPQYTRTRSVADPCRSERISPKQRHAAVPWLNQFT